MFMKYSIVTRIYTEILINQAVDNFTSSRFRESRISGRSIFKIPDGKCAGIQICPQRTNSPAGILCHFREKYRKQHKIQNNNECLKTVNSAARVSSIKVVKSCNTVQQRNLKKQAYNTLVFDLQIMLGLLH